MPSTIRPHRDNACGGNNRRRPHRARRSHQQRRPRRRAPFPTASIGHSTQRRTSSQQGCGSFGPRPRPRLVSVPLPFVVRAYRLNSARSAPMWFWIRTAPWRPIDGGPGSDDRSFPATPAGAARCDCRCRRRVHRGTDSRDGERYCDHSRTTGGDRRIAVHRARHADRQHGRAGPRRRWRRCSGRRSCDRSSGATCFQSTRGGSRERRHEGAALVGRRSLRRVRDRSCAAVFLAPNRSVARKVRGR